MRVRRMSAVAVAVAIAAAVAFTSARAHESTRSLGGPGAPRLTIAQAAIAPVAARAAASWGDGHSDDRRPASVGLPAAGALAIAAIGAAGVVLLASLAAAYQARRVAVQVRGPPLLHSFA